MRVFWIIVALLAVIALGTLKLSGDDKPSSSTSDGREVAMAPSAATGADTDTQEALRTSVTVVAPTLPAVVDDANAETSGDSDQQADDIDEPIQPEALDAGDTTPPETLDADYADARSATTPDDTTSDPAPSPIVVDDSPSDPADDVAQDTDSDETAEPATTTEPTEVVAADSDTEAATTDDATTNDDTTNDDATSDNDTADNDTTDRTDEAAAQAPSNDDAAKALVQELLTSVQQRAEDEDGSNGESLDDALDDTLSDVDPAAEGNETPAAVQAEHTIVAREDGSMLVDNRFIVRGTGAQDDPYIVSWEMLVSAYETYQPREGQTEIPERIAMLNDAYVKVTGYLAFPMAGGEISEALVMLNAWDGCCIGVPPSPYDSIEVRLAEPASLDGGHVTPYGTIEGVFKVDPYLVNKWLVGLYLFEDATLDMGL